MSPRHYILRLVRGGPLLPARIWFCDHDPADPDNKLDRGRLSLYPRADIAGVEVEPELLADRLYSMTDPTPAHPPTHWRYAAPCSEAEYRWRLDSLRWAETNRPDDPVLQPRKKLAAADVEVPDFSREEEALL
jgi:hypothetical protein